jgi:hypothetical protein
MSLKSTQGIFGDCDALGPKFKHSTQGSIFNVFTDHLLYTCLSQLLLRWIRAEQTLNSVIQVQPHLTSANVPLASCPAVSQMPSGILGGRHSALSKRFGELATTD